MKNWRGMARTLRWLSACDVLVLVGWTGVAATGHAPWWVVLVWGGVFTLPTVACLALLERLRAEIAASQRAVGR
jgi:hypothetical protein